MMKASHINRYAKKKGRGASSNTPNGFDKHHFVPFEEQLIDEEQRSPSTTFLIDTSRTILARNESPDIPFAYSLNPYRGCEHGCIYCYARPSHEYLGFSAGLDFESKILIKEKAPALLTRELSKKSWEPQVVALSGNTDCYQPIERKFQLTRKCLEVFLRFRNPVGLITKNALVLRDVDILTAMAEQEIVHVLISITSLNQELIRKMEPRTSSPIKRLQAIEVLAKAGIPVGVNIGPVIPGLTDEEIPRIMQAAADHGATRAGYILLRLPGAVKQLFVDWLENNLPERANKILHSIQETRNGKLDDSRFGTRMHGEGRLADLIDQLFHAAARKHKLSTRWGQLSTDHFHRETNGQIEIFQEAAN